ncbi:SPS-sensor component PTR3 [Pichia kudriavzevii]|uniref:SPS-sensor component PTR3 n=1 Tax=Pichia kudriavzevii TaxID=4909 RepID=A0A1V2LPD1_PICKU|nr:SPS-sensor component PTR3 [Pichia kudriavzevii]
MVTAQDIAHHLQLLTSIPVDVDISTSEQIIKYGPANDAVILSCGCIVSAKLAHKLESSPKNTPKCPICYSSNITVLAKCSKLRDLNTYLVKLTDELSNENSISSLQDHQKDTSYIPHKPTKNIDLANTDSTDMRSMFSNINIDSSSCVLPLEKQPASLITHEARSDSANLTFLTAFHEALIEADSSSVDSTVTAKPSPLNAKDSFNVHDFNHSPKNSPSHSPKSLSLISCAGSPHKQRPRHSFSQNTSNLTRMLTTNSQATTKQQYTSKPSINKEFIYSKNFPFFRKNALELLDNWEHLNCQITKNLLIISGTRGFLRVIDINHKGKCIFTYQCNFPIRCLDISPNEDLIALGITGKDKYTQVEQAVIILLKLVPKTSKTPLQICTYPFSLPHRDPIGKLKFSSDSIMLAVSTVLESRFLIINLTHPSRPTLVMKSQRRLDTSLDSEGITDMAFFPDNRLMTICSLSHNSEPIIIDTNIASISGPDGIAKPKLLMKIDEVGSTIHKCCVSPRGDSVAYINRSGNVYIMTAPRMDDNDNRRVVSVFEVSNATRVKEAASLKFDPDGYKLYTLDRKGVLTIADFTAGTVEDHTVTRSKIVS